MDIVRHEAFPASLPSVHLPPVVGAVNTSCLFFARSTEAGKRVPVVREEDEGIMRFKRKGGRAVNAPLGIDLHLSLIIATTVLFASPVCETCMLLTFLDFGLLRNGSQTW